MTLINLTTLPMMLLEPLMEPKITKRDIAHYWYCFNAYWRSYASTSIKFKAMDVICCKYCNWSRTFPFVVDVSSSLISDYFAWA